MINNNLSQCFAINLKRYRKKAKLTQASLGELLGYSEKAVAKWESGKALPSVESMAQIAKTFRVKIDDLLVDLQNQYLLGIDGGGTKTHYMLCDENANVIKEKIDIGCNPYDIGIEKCAEVLSTGINDILGDIERSSVTVFAGIAGGIDKSNQKALKEYFAPEGFRAFEVNSDNENIIKAGLDGEEGLSLILGTGVCLFVVKGEERIRKSGWGYLIDEGGSAYNIGIDAIKSYYSYIDGHIQKSHLHIEIENEIKCTPQEFLNEIYKNGKRYVAKFAPMVFECAKKYDDEIAKNIIDKNIEEVAKILDNGLEHFKNSSKPVECVLSGGITKEESIIEHISAKLTNPGDIQFKVLDKPMVVGAVKKAKEIYINSLKEEKEKC